MSELEPETVDLAPDTTQLKLKHFGRKPGRVDVLGKEGLHLVPAISLHDLAEGATSSPIQPRPRSSCNLTADLDANVTVYTVEETAHLLRISRSAAYEAVRRGQIPALRLGRRLRVPRRALEELLDTAGAINAQSGG